MWSSCSDPHSLVSYLTLAAIAMSSSTAASISSEWDYYQCDYVDSYNYEAERQIPLYPLIGQPLVYYAQIQPNKKGRRNKGNPNCFKKAFKWYTQDRNTPNVEKTDGNMNPDIPTFATWLDSKYEEFLRDNQERKSVSTKRTSENSQNDEIKDTQEECAPCEERNRTHRFKSPWCKRRQNPKQETEKLDKSNKSLEYIMQPKIRSCQASVVRSPGMCSCSDTRISIKRSATNFQTANVKFIPVDATNVDEVTTKDELKKDKLSDDSKSSVKVEWSNVVIDKASKPYLENVQKAETQKLRLSVTGSKNHPPITNYVPQIQTSRNNTELAPPVKEKKAEENGVNELNSIHQKIKDERSNKNKKPKDKKDRPKKVICECPRADEVVSKMTGNTKTVDDVAQTGADSGGVMCTQCVCPTFCEHGTLCCRKPCVEACVPGGDDGSPKKAVGRLVVCPHMNTRDMCNRPTHETTHCQFVCRATSPVICRWSAATRQCVAYRDHTDQTSNHSITFGNGYKSPLYMKLVCAQKLTDVGECHCVKKQ